MQYTNSKITSATSLTAVHDVISTHIFSIPIHEPPYECLPPLEQHDTTTNSVMDHDYERRRSAAPCLHKVI